LLMMLGALPMRRSTSKRVVNQGAESIVPVGEVIGHFEEFVTGVVELN
jgi:hypothetical protein